MAAGPATAERERATPEPRPPGARRRDLAGALLAMVLAILGAVIVMRLWRADLRVPFAYEGDAIFNATTVKGLIDHAWWFSNENLGAPFGQDLHDFAMGLDHLHLLALKLLGLVTGDAALALNLYFLAGFPLTALFAFLVLRWLGISSGPAVVCSVLFALTPFVFLRGEVHLFTALVFPVPLAAYLVLGVARGSPLLERRPGRRGVLAWASRRSLLTLAACLVVGSTGSFYYPAFALILLAAGALVGFAATRDRARLVAAGATMAAIAVTTGLNLLPTAVYALDHGRNPSVAERKPAESEYHGLKLAQMLLPVERHRIQSLADLKEDYATTTTPRAPNESFSATLGLAGSVGLLWLMTVALASLAAPGRWLRDDDRERHLSASALIALVVGTVGGFGAVFAFVVTPQLRGWNRISIFIAFLSLAAVALLLDRARARIVRRSSGGAWFAALLAAVLVVALYDQTSNAFIPPYDQLEAQYRGDDRFVEAIERALPGEAAVLQLPAMAFPESPPIGGLKDYELSRPYLHSDRLRWSYGAMKERPQDWQWALPERPAVLPAAAAAAGFGGIYIDRAAYPDRARALETALSERLGAPPLTDESGRLAFFDLTAYGRRLGRARSPADLRELRTATLRPLRLEQEDGTVVRQPAGKAVVTGLAGTVRLWLANPTSRPRRATLTVALRGGTGAPVEAGIRYPDGSTQALEVSRRPISTGREVTVAPGRRALDVAAPPALRFQLAIAVTDSAFVPFGLLPCSAERMLRGC